MMVNRKTYRNVTLKKIDQIIAHYRDGSPVELDG